MSPVESGHLLGTSPLLGPFHAFLFFSLEITESDISEPILQMGNWVPEGHGAWSESHAVRDCLEISIGAYPIPKLFQCLYIHSKYFLTDRQKVGMGAKGAPRSEGHVGETDLSVPLDSTSKVRKQRPRPLSPKMETSEWVQGAFPGHQPFMTVTCLCEVSCWLFGLTPYWPPCEETNFSMLFHPPLMPTVWDISIAPRPPYDLGNQRLHASPSLWV